jgi:hypothetical protein
MVVEFLSKVEDLLDLPNALAFMVYDENREEEGEDFSDCGNCIFISDDEDTGLPIGDIELYLLSLKESALELNLTLEESALYTLAHE